MTYTTIAPNTAWQAAEQQAPPLTQENQIQHSFWQPLPTARFSVYVKYDGHLPPSPTSPHSVQTVFTCTINYLYPWLMKTGYGAVVALLPPCSQ